MSYCVSVASSDFRNSVPRFSVENRRANHAVVDLLIEVAECKHATAARAAPAWVLAQKPWMVPIPGRTNMHRLEENLGAAEVVLTPQEIREPGTRKVRSE